MTEQFNGIGLHIIFDGVSTDQEQGRLLRFLDLLRPATVNLVRGARGDQAFTFARLLKQRYPGMRVIWRIWPDDGNWCKDIYRDPANWIRMAQPFLDAGLTVLTDNESTMADYRPYALWQASVMDTCAIRGWSVAVGRTPTGNPGDGTGGSAYQYQQLLPMFQALHRHGNLHVFSPNEYQGQGYMAQGGATPGHTFRLRHSFDVIDAAGLHRPVTDVGEWAIARQEPSGWLDPGKGWQSIDRLSGLDYAGQLVTNFRKYYQGNGVTCSLYSWGDSLSREWDSFRVDVDGNLQAALISARPMTLYTPNGWVTHPSPRLWKVTLPAGNTYVNVRAEANVLSPVQRRLANGDTVTITGDRVDTSGILWHQLTDGWVSTQGKPGQPRVIFTPIN